MKHSDDFLTRPYTCTSDVCSPDAHGLGCSPPRIPFGRAWAEASRRIWDPCLDDGPRGPGLVLHEELDSARSQSAMDLLIIFYRIPIQIVIITTRIFCEKGIPMQIVIITTCVLVSLQ